MLSPSKHGRVLVIDEDGMFLIPTTSANARRLLKEKKARIETYKPFTIKLTKTISNLDVQGRIKNMKIQNLHEFFAEPKPVYIQNTSEPIGVLSLEFKSQDGDVIPFKVPANRNPINLTNVVDFEIIKRSAIFKRFLQPTPFGPSKLQILSEPEYITFYEKRRRDLGVKSSNQVMQQAEEDAAKFNISYETKEKIVPEREAMTMDQLRGVGDNDIPEVIPKVVSICLQLDPENANPLSPREALDTLSSLNLKLIDLDYIIGHTYDHIRKENVVIRKWAIQRQLDFGNQENSGIITEEVAVGKKKRGRKPKKVEG